MGRPACFFFPLPKDFQAKQLTSQDISQETQQHLKSNRISLGEIVTFINGAGLIVQAQCTDRSPWNFEVKSIEAASPPKKSIHLIISPPKGDALAQSIQQSTEAGVQEIFFFKSEHNQIPKQKPLPLARLKKIAQTSTEQAYRPFLPTIHPEYLSLESIKELAQKSFLLFADEDLSTTSPEEAFRENKKIKTLAQDKTNFYILIGPEGGWSQKERNFFKTQGHSIYLGPHIMRVPTACVCALSLTFRELF